MTGESDELKKDTLENCMMRKEEKDAEYGFTSKDAGKSKGTPHDVPSVVMLSGTQVATGEGWFVCIVVGKESCVGKIMSKLEQKVETTPLQKKLEAIGSDIGKVGIYVALLTIHVLFMRFFIERLMNRTFDLFGGEGEDGKIRDYAK